MGTRSTTHFKENGKNILSLFKMYDGYTEGWGKELKEFLESGRFVNGIRSQEKNETIRQFNGFGDFALQVVTHFKTGVGEIYATTEDEEAEVNYIVSFDDEGNDEYTLKLECTTDPDFKFIYKRKLGDLLLKSNLYVYRINFVGGSFTEVIAKTTEEAKSIIDKTPFTEKHKIESIENIREVTI